MADARVQAARDEIAAQIQAYRDLVGAASKASGMSLVRIDAALAAFEPAFFNNLLVALEKRFEHSTREMVDAAGNPLCEAHRIVQSLLHAGGVMSAPGAGGYDVDRSVLRIDVGERIALNADDFEAMCTAFLAEIERRNSP